MHTIRIKLYFRIPGAPRFRSLSGENVYPPVEGDTKLATTEITITDATTVGTTTEGTTEGTTEATTEEATTTSTPIAATPDDCIAPSVTVSRAHIWDGEYLFWKMFNGHPAYKMDNVNITRAGERPHKPVSVVIKRLTKPSYTGYVLGSGDLQPGGLTIRRQHYHLKSFTTSTEKLICPYNPTIQWHHKRTSKPTGIRITKN